MRLPELIEHPEGGRFAEVFRSAVEIRRDGVARSALTHIYFQLGAGEVSRFHRVESDEVWNLYEGSLRLILWDGRGRLETIILSAAETFAVTGDEFFNDFFCDLHSSFVLIAMTDFKIHT